VDTVGLAAVAVRGQTPCGRGEGRDPGRVDGSPSVRAVSGSAGTGRAGRADAADAGGQGGGLTEPHLSIVVVETQLGQWNVRDSTGGSDHLLYRIFLGQVEDTVSRFVVSNLRQSYFSHATHLFVGAAGVVSNLLHSQRPIAESQRGQVRDTATGDDRRSLAGTALSACLPPGSSAAPPLRRCSPTPWRSASVTSRVRAFG